MKIKHIVPLKTKKKVEKFIADWREQLNLTGWAILVEWTQEEHMTQTSGRAAAWVNCDPIYRRANISINEKSFAHTLKCTGEEFAYGYVIHELVHVFLADYDDLVDRRFITDAEFNKVRESTVESLSRLLIKLTK